MAGREDADIRSENDAVDPGQSWLLELNRRLLAAANVESCLELFAQALVDLSRAARAPWSREMEASEEPSVQQCLRVVREQRSARCYARSEPTTAGARAGLCVPLPPAKGQPELMLFERAAPFSPREQSFATLAASMLDAAVRCQVALSRERESQALLQQSERMRSVGQLAGGIAHDFNNMLMVVSAAAEVMHDTLTAEAEPGGREHPCLGHLNLIINTTHRAAELTQKLLTFSRKARLLMKPIDVLDVLGAVREFLVHALDPRIAVSASLAGGPYIVEGDSTQLQNALLNVCLNARDAMPDGGQLEISTRRVELGAPDAASAAALKAGPYVEIAVRDTGTGMDEQTLQQAFDPFFTTKEPGRGTGLGLAVVLGSIREHGGNVTLESHVGQGTRCTILLPLAEPGRSEAGVGPARASANQSLRILLVDDEPGVCRTAAQLLRQLGHNVQALRDGERALSHLRTHASGYDLLVLDVMMPHPTGVEVHRALLDDDVRLPTVFMSGSSEQHLLDGVAAQDGLVFLQKPFRQADLSSAIARCMEGWRKRLNR